MGLAVTWLGHTSFVYLAAVLSGSLQRRLFASPHTSTAAAADATANRHQAIAKQKGSMSLKGTKDADALVDVPNGLQNNGKPWAVPVDSGARCGDGKLARGHVSSIHLLLFARQAAAPASGG